MFALREEHQGLWTMLQGTNAVKLFGFQYAVGVEPVNVNVERMINTFYQGLTDLEPVWSQILEPDTMKDLLALRRVPHQQFHIANEVWARLVYDAAAAYHKRVMPREHLLKAFTPLYLGRTASFVLETQGLTTQEEEGRIEQLCLAFEQQKPYLIARWGDQKT